MYNKGEICYISECYFLTLFAMDLSMFLAQIFGLFYVLIGIAFIARPKHYYKVFRKLLKNSSMKFVLSMMAFAVGFSMIAYHNIWEWHWRVIITIIGWAALLKAILYMLFPGRMKDLGYYVVRSRNSMLSYGAICVLLGLILCYLGFGV